MPTALFDLIFQNRSEFGEIIPKSFLRKPHREINFSEEFLRYLKFNPKEKLTLKDIVNPEKCAKLIKKIQKNLGVEWSYGGWMENRSAILQNSYLKTTQSWIHLGIDINLPIGAPICATTKGMVYMANSDYPEKGGWGNYVILEHQIDGIKFYSISGHLSNKLPLTKGQKIVKGEIIGHVGNTKENGSWFPHLHFQFISVREMRLKENPFTLDGYGKPENLEYLRENYPHPLVALPMGKKE